MELPRGDVTSDVWCGAALRERTVSDRDNCKPFANGGDVTGPHRNGLDDTTARRFVGRSARDRAGWVQTDGSRRSSSPPSDTAKPWVLQRSRAPLGPSC